MVILQLLPEVSSIQLQPMEIQFNYESQEHHLLSGEQYIFFGFRKWGQWGDITFDMLVSSSTVGIRHCLSLTLLGSTISLVLQAQSYDFIVNSGNQILMEFFSFKSPKLSIFSPIIITLSPVCQCLVCPTWKSFQVIVLIYYKGVVKNFVVWQPGFKY